MCAYRMRTRTNFVKNETLAIMQKFLHILAIFLILLIGQNANAQQTLITRMLEGEKWWGGLNDITNRRIQNAPSMPYDCSSIVSLDLQDQNYSNAVVPFFVSNKGRYIWSDAPIHITFNAGEITVNSESEIELCTVGSTLRSAFLDASAKHFAPSGVLPPEEFVLSPQYNTWIELIYNQNQKDIESYAQAIVDNGFPHNSVLMVDDNWQKYYGNFEFKPEQFSDPKAMMDRLHTLGFKVMFWICPFVSPDSPEYRMLAKKKWLVKEAGSYLPAVVKWWNGRSAEIDLSNPKAYAYFKNILQTMQKEYGVDGFKFDAGDPITYLKDEVKVSDEKSYGVRHTELWTKLGLEFPYNEFRACWKQAGNHVVLRLQDKPYSWDGVAELMPCMINSSMMGYLYVCPDMIGGGDFASFMNVTPDNVDQELIVRSCQIHAMMPMMQFSVAPWRILDKEHLDACRKAAWLHTELGSFFIEQLRRASETGEPVVRPMDYSFPGQGLEACTDQYMLGDTYLVAPMYNPGLQRSVTLPKGTWVDEQGRRYRGARTYIINVPIDRIPYFTKVK